MPHTRYTREIRIRERSRFNRQMKEFCAFVRAFRSAPDAPVEIAPIPSAKERRSARLDQKRRRKLGHQTEIHER
jgi:hypothetical protein